MVERRGVLIEGWGQIKQKDDVSEVDRLDAIGMMKSASLRAADTAGSPDILKKVDGVMVVRVLSSLCSEAAKKLSSAIGASPRFTEVSGIGGSSPQSLINRAVGMIARGELDRVLIAGAETYRSTKRLGSGQGNALFQGLVGGHEREDMVGATSLEMRHGVTLPIHGFPLFETALWAESGQNIETYMLGVGQRWSEFSHVAAKHPQGWTSTPRSAEEIARPTPANRWISFPYTKYMNPQIYVDLGAAVIVGRDEGGKLSTHKGRPVYFLGGACAEDRQPFLVQRTSFTDSSPLRAASASALRRSRLTLDEIGGFDLYSCFPCAVSIAQRALGIAPDDRRPATLTGGLGFFGGPGNNYSLHAVATLAASIARGQYETGMVTGLGWFMHKHAVGVYGSRPPQRDVSHDDLEDQRDKVVGDEPLPVESRPKGLGTIETYTVLFSRDGEPLRSVIYGVSENGGRFVARTRNDPEIFKALMSSCHVGSSVNVRHVDDSGVNLVELKV